MKEPTMRTLLAITAAVALLVSVSVVTPAKAHFCNTTCNDTGGGSTQCSTYCY
jgi:hypothetical protein